MSVPSASLTTILAGELHKRGKVNSSWKKRWFVLNRSKLEYYDDNDSKNASGSIDLLQIQKIEVSHLKDTKKSSIPKYIKILNNDKIKDTRSFLILLTTPKRVYKLSANNNISFLKWLKHLHEQLYENIIYESYLEKKNANNKLFETFYFVLNNQKHLKYYNNETRDILLGYIDLKSHSFILNLQTIDNFVELVPDQIKDNKSTLKLYELYTKHEKHFHKWCHNLRFNNYNKNEMNENDNFDIESDSEENSNTTFNLSGQNLQIIPISLCKNIANNVTKLVLNNNQLKSLDELKYFSKLKILQLDRNNLTNIDDLPKLSHLTTLWLNNNNISNLNSLLLILKQQCPNLEYLSLLFNPCSTMHESENKRYRLTFIYHLSNLKYLDTQRVRYKERHDSIYGCDDDKNDKKNDKEISVESNLFRYKTKNTWSEMSLEQHEEELRNQLMISSQVNDAKSSFYEY